MSAVVAVLVSTLALAAGATSPACSASRAPDLTGPAKPGGSNAPQLPARGRDSRKRKAPTLRQVDGGPRYYSRFLNALPSKPSYFPIGVWFESVLSQRDINMDKAAGLNTYVVLTGNSKLSLLRRNGMKALLQHEQWRSSPAVGSQTAGWELRDEIDMEMSPASGYAELQRIKSTLPSDRRLRYNNFGKGVVFWHSNLEAGRYVNAVDLSSTDVYWFNDEDACQASQGGRLLGLNRRLTNAECYRASNYGAQTKRVRNLVSPAGSKPVWTFVEVGTPFPDRGSGVSPAQIRAAVWHALIAGARGIIYFNHSFGGPCQTQHALREPCYSNARATVAGTNKQIKALAPVLNAPFVTSGWSHSPATKAMVKWQGGHFYVFAGSAQNLSSVRSFAIRCVGNARAKVMGEHRTIPIRRGAFSDAFPDGNAVHIYRIDRGSSCGLKRRS
jgi:hypothetical protein